MTTQTRDTVMSHPIGEDGVLVVHLHDGRIHVRGVTGDLATVRSMDGEPLDGLEIETGERSLAIRSPRGPEFGVFGLFVGRGRGRARDLEIEIPHGVTVVVESASADVDVRGTHGDQRYRTASGDLVLREVRGSLTIEAVSGDVDVSADGPATIVARTVSGDLDLRAESLGELRATTTSGDLQITGRFDGAGPYAIETVSGDATLAPGNGVRIEARTIAGDLDSELPSRRDDAPGRRALIIGEGGPTITFRSTSGDLRVVAATPMSARTPAVPPTPPTPPSPPTPAVPAQPPTPVAASSPRPATKRVERTPADTEADDARLGVLRALENGDIDVAEAGRRLAALDDGEPLDQPTGTAAADLGDDDDA